MKISLDWLGEYLDWNISDPQEVARAVTGHTAEVDDVIEQGALMNKCCVGKVTDLQKHPNADKLSICKVHTDDGVKSIVCGGTNLRDGMKVAFAHIGAKVQTPDGSLFELSKAKIRGETSEGMICANVELDLESQFPTTPEQGDRPVIDLGDGDDGVGLPLKEYLGLTDTVLDVDNHAITQRPDLFSHIGFARELVAMGAAKWKKSPDFMAPEFTNDAIPFTFEVKDEALMPRYCACIIEIDELGETPDWMKRRLEATGWRSINLPIDITNYVMMEVGVPLHSFDADDIKGTVHMRPAKEGEKITTLDGSERELSEGALILSDDEGNFDLLGIMGGLRSSTKADTKRIYLHTCSLDPVSIRNAMIKMGHRTDAGTTYEKGVPPITTEQGFYRAAQLMLELIPGARIASVLDSVGDNGQPELISLQIDYVHRMLGVEIEPKQVEQILSDLGCDVQQVGDVFSVIPPLWRIKDMQGPHDLIEEIGRIYGYDNIEAQLPDENITPPARDTRTHAVRDTLKDRGYFELIPLSLISPDLLRKCNFDPANAEEIENPIGEELSLMQMSILPRLLEQAEEQLRHCDDVLKTFHIGRVFEANKKGEDAEHIELGMLLSSKKPTQLTNDPFLMLKSHLQDAFAAAGYDISITPAKEVPVYAHPGRTADVFIGDTFVGYLAEVHPAVREQFDLPERAAAALINMHAALDCEAQVRVANKLSQYPAVRYDVTIEFDQTKSVAELMENIRGTSELLEDVEVADVYAPNAGSNLYNLTLRLTYRSHERTLTEEEVKPEHDNILKAIS